jgi:hypothetical protein
MPIKSCTLPEGGSGFKWGDSGHCYPTREQAEKQAAAAHANGYVGDMALDSSARTIDTDGRMHIDRSHISKAAVNPYYGFEIPNAEMLGLDPQKIYYLLRSPEELAKGAETFARLPILKKHIPVSANSPRQDLVVGAIGSEVTFLDPYLDADVCIWDAQAIAGIETETMREFSCAYHYVPLMTPGEYNGEPYDGIMTQIRGNHLALVESGRAGSDVLAADQKMKGIPMKMTKLGKALFVSLTTAFPKLAADTNLPGLLATASKKNFNKAEFRGKVLAMDAAVPGEQLDLVMDAMMDNQEDPEPTEPKKKPAEDEETEEEKKAREKKETEEKEARDKKAKDEAEVEGEKKTKAAMDSFRAELRDAEEARREVRPVVGDVLAQDSAADIYTFALDHMKVDHAGVTGVPALKALFKLANTKAAPASRVAQDSAGLVAQFPNAARFRQA